MSKNLSAKYQENKEKMTNQISNFSKEEKEKSDNMDVNVTKISKDEKQKLVEDRKKYRIRKNVFL